MRAEGTAAGAVAARECNLLREGSSLPRESGATSLYAGQLRWGEAPEGPPLSVRFRRPCGSAIALASEDGGVRALDPSTGQFLWQPAVKASENAVFGLDWLNSTLALASGSQAAYVLHERDGDRPVSSANLTGHSGSVKDVCICDTSGLIATASRDGDAKMWDTRAPSKKRCVNTIVQPHLRETRPRNPCAVTSVCWLAGGTALATGGDKDGLVKVWDTRKQADPIAAMTGCGSRPRGVSSLFAHPRERTIAGATFSDGTTACIDCCSGSVRFPYLDGSGERSFYVQGAFSCDGSLLAAGDGGNSVAMWDVETGRLRKQRNTWPIAVLTSHTAEATALDFSPTDPLRLVSCSDDYTVKLWRKGRDRGLHKPPASHRRRKQKAQAENGDNQRTKVARAPSAEPSYQCSRTALQERDANTVNIRRRHGATTIVATATATGQEQQHVEYDEHSVLAKQQRGRKRGRERSISSYFG